MIREAELTAGLEPGLRFAVVLDGRGGCNELDWKGVSAWRKDQGFLWVHLERDTPEAKRWIQERSSVDSLAAESLLAEESRPRVEAMEDALVLVLRGGSIFARRTPLSWCRFTSGSTATAPSPFATRITL